MRVRYNKDGNRKEESDLTLAEQTKDKLYLDDEVGNDGKSREIRNAELEEVQGCENIGIIEFDSKEIESIEESRIPEPIDKCLYLQGVSYAEQQGSRVYVEFTDGHTTKLSGEFDRAYTY